MSYGTAFEQLIYYNSPIVLKNGISSVYGWLQKRRRYGAAYDHYLDSLLRSQWYQNERLEEIQFRKLKQFLEHTKRYSKHYRNLFEEYNFQPERMQSFSDLGCLPILRKDTVRANTHEIIPDNVAKYNVRWSHTSGTTGSGLRFPLSSECFQREHAFSTLHYMWGNIRRGDKFAFCSGHPVASPDRRMPPFWVYDYANNCLLLSSYHLSERNLRHYIGELERFQPCLLTGYPSSIYLLALANEYCGKKVHPRAIFTASETLFDFQRTKIENSFGCKVFVWYGNSEMCCNIVECEKGKYHLKLEHSYIEFLDNSSKATPIGQEGRLVCTGFGNYAFPLIRYSIEDIAVLSADKNCLCGRGGRIIERIVGRTEDYIVTPDGRLIGRLDHLFKDAVHVKLAQIIQNKVEEIIILIVKDSSFGKKDEQGILEEARVRLGPSMKINVEYVSDIARLDNGKYRFIISHIEGDVLKKEFLSRMS